MKNKNNKEENGCCDWLINYISEPIKSVGDSKGKNMSLFKTNTTMDYSKPRRFNNLHDGGKNPRSPKVQKEKMKNRKNNYKYKKSF